jgi:hypothetical protein
MLLLWFVNCAFRRARVSPSGRAFGDVVDFVSNGFGVD